MTVPDDRSHAISAAARERARRWLARLLTRGQAAGPRETKQQRPLRGERPRKK